MRRCTFLIFLLGLVALSALPAAADPVRTRSRMLVQASPVAGFKYHEGKAVWDRMRVGDALALVREPDNPYDAKAVRVEWQGHMLGYVPRRENAAAAGMLDRGAPLEARIVRLKKTHLTRERVWFEVYQEL